MTSIRARRRKPKAQRRWTLPSESPDAPYFSKSLARALDIIELFSDGRKCLSLREIGRLITQPESSIYRVLFTLEMRGYMVRGEDGAYQLAPKLAAASLYERAEAIRRRVRPVLERLNHLFDETVTLAFLFENRVQVVEVLEGFQDNRITQTQGKVLPPYCSSLGKAITAYQPKDLADLIIQAYGLMRRTENTIIDRLSLIAEFERIRECGYAVDREEAIPGAICFGGPILDAKDCAVAAISISVPSIRVTAEREAAMTRSIIDASRQASEMTRFGESNRPAPLVRKGRP